MILNLYRFLELSLETMCQQSLMKERKEYRFLELFL